MVSKLNRQNGEECERVVSLTLDCGWLSVFTSRWGSSTSKRTSTKQIFGTLWILFLWRGSDNTTPNHTYFWQPRTGGYLPFPSCTLCVSVWYRMRRRESYLVIPQLVSDSLLVVVQEVSSYAHWENGFCSVTLWSVSSKLQKLGCLSLFAPVFQNKWTITMHGQKRALSDPTCQLRWWDSIIDANKMNCALGDVKGPLQACTRMPADWNTSFIVEVWPKQLSLRVIALNLSLWGSPEKEALAFSLSGHLLSGLELGMIGNTFFDVIDTFVTGCT